MSDGAVTITKSLEKISTPRGVAACFALYGVINALITRGAGPALALDDVKLNILTQSLQAGYLPENPPLFEWLLIFVQSFSGPTVWSFVIVKYALLTVAGVFCFLTARIIIGEVRWAALTAASLLLVYQIGWNYHQTLTHSTALLAATAFFWWALLRLLRSNDIGGYCLFGASIGLGVLAKYSFLASGALAVFAVLATAEGRRVFISPRLLASLLIAGIVVTPHLLWLMADNADIAAETSSRLVNNAAPYWRRVADGLPSAVWAIATFFLPLTLLLLASFSGMVTQAFASVDNTALVRRATLAGGAGLLAGVIVLGVDNMQERYALAFLYPGIFWLLAIAKTVSTKKSLLRFAVLSIGAISLMTGLRIVETLVAGPPFCGHCRQWVPYDYLADAIEKLDIENATLVGFEDNTAGNLRRMFPNFRVLSAHMPFYTPPGGRVGDKCYFIWSQELGPPVPEQVISAVDPAQVWKVEAPWRSVFRKQGWRVTHWTIAEFSHKPGIARSLCRPTGWNQS